jgi:hypothetical protein
LAVACHQALAGWPGHPASQPGTPGAMELGFYYRAVPTPSTEGPATVFLPQRLPQRSTLCPHLVSTEPADTSETSVSSSDDVQASFFYLPCHAHHSAVPTDRPEKARGRYGCGFQSIGPGRDKYSSRCANWRLLYSFRQDPLMSSPLFIARMNSALALAMRIPIRCLT